MTMGGGTGEGAAGGPARHVPVLARPALEFLRVRDGGRYIDGTFGAGGHSRLMLAAGAARVVAIDRDPAAIAGGAALVAASEIPAWLFSRSLKMTRPSPSMFNVSLVP